MRIICGLLIVLLMTNALPSVAVDCGDMSESQIAHVLAPDTDSHSADHHCASPDSMSTGDDCCGVCVAATCDAAAATSAVMNSNNPLKPIATEALPPHTNTLFRPPIA